MYDMFPVFHLVFLPSSTSLVCLASGTVSVLASQLARIDVCRLDGVHAVDVHLVNLLQGSILRLNDEEEDDEEKSRTTSGENQTVQVVDCVSNKASEERDQKVPEPIGRRCQRHAAATVPQWVQFGIYSPHKGSPADGKRCNGKAREGHEGRASLGCPRWVFVVQGKMSDKGVNEEAHHHPSSPRHEDRTTPKSLDDPQTQDRAEHIDGPENELSDIAVADARGRKHGGAEIEEEVGTGELLASLEDYSQDGAVEHPWASEDLAPLETGRVALLLVELGLEVVDLPLHFGCVGRQPTKFGNVAAGIFCLAPAVGKPRTFRKEKDANTQDQSPGEGKAVRYSPRRTGVHLLGAPVDHFGRPDTQSDQKLVGRHDNAANDGGHTLGLVHGDNNREGTDTQARYETSHCELWPIGIGGNLNDGTDTGEEGGSRDGETPANRIGQLARDECADQGSHAY